MIEDINKYLEERAQLLHSKWAGKAKRFQSNHADLEKVRMEVFTPFSHMAGFDDYAGLKAKHFCLKNPIAHWNNLKFLFNPQGLLDELARHGFDVSSVKIDAHRKRLAGQEVPKPDVTPRERYSPNLAYDLEEKYHAWLERVYQIASEVETVTVTCGETKMSINRYRIEGVPFGYYELNPCKQLTCNYPLLMQETEFNTLNVATLFMQMVVEQKLRHEEFSYMAKKLKLFHMEAVTTQGIEFALWDEAKVEKKVREYVEKGYDLSKCLNLVLRPWRKAANDFIEKITHRDMNSELMVKKWVFWYSKDAFDDYVRNEVKPYLIKAGLNDVNVIPPSENCGNRLILELGGIYYILAFPLGKPEILLELDEKRFINEYFNSKIMHEYAWDQHEFNYRNISLGAIGEYIKLSADFNEQLLETRRKVIALYDELKSKR